jgi:chromosome partitioning protein
MLAAMRVLAVVNMKGGVGKTTTAVHIAAGWAIGGSRVLLVDADPQGNAGLILGAQSSTTIRDVMLGDATAAEAVVAGVRPRLDMICATPSAFALEGHLAGAVQRETILSRRLAGLTGYDAVVVDTSPSMSLLAYNALLFANELVVPVGMDSLAVAGARQTLDGVAEIRRLWPDRRLSISAIVPNAISLHTHAARATLAALADDPEMQAHVFPPGIRQCLDLTYAAAAHQTIWEYAPRSRAAEDYSALLQFLGIAGTREDEIARTNGDETPAVAT